MFVEIKREGEIVQKGMTLSGLIEWLRKQPSDGTYVFANARECALGQYYRSIGRRPVHFINDPAREMGIGVFDLASALGDAPLTFGAALKRCEKIARQ